MDTISLKDTMKQIYSGESFDIGYITLDRKRNKGGELKSFRGAKFNTSGDSKPELRNPLAKPVVKKHPIKINIKLQSGDIKTVYKAGIVKFNDKNVVI